MQDYVPDGLSDFAEALANPIKYQSELEKRSEQLAVLLSEDVDTADEDANNSCKNQTFSISSVLTSILYVSLCFSLCLFRNWFLVHPVTHYDFHLFFYLLIHSIFCVFTSFPYRKPIPQLCLFL